MKHLIIERIPKITASFNYNDWGYEEDTEYSEILNSQLEFLVNSGFSKEHTLKVMYDEIKKYNGDNKQLSHLYEVLNEIYGN